MELIKIDNSKCSNCMACIRICPVKAIKIGDKSNYPEVIHERCIGCGSCLTVCSPAAISYKMSIEEVKDFLRSTDKVAVLVDPAIAAEFTDIADYRKFVEMLRQIGFDYVLEVSFGVDLVGFEYNKLFNNFKGRYYIMSCCPAVVSLVEKHHPGIINNLAPIVSPMIAMAKVARKKYGKDIKVVTVGPCIASKIEAGLFNDDGKVDAVLTFTELRELIKEKKIRQKTLEFSEFDEPEGFKGSLYPISRGILEAGEVDRGVLTGKVVTAEGRNSTLECIREFEKYIDSIKTHFNIFYNEGCLMGPGMSPNGEKYLRRTLVVEYSNKRIKALNKEEWKSNIEDFSALDLSRKFTPDDQRLSIPSNEKIKEILAMMNKKENENELGCFACGYDSCKDFAIAIAQGLSKPDMCLMQTLTTNKEYIKNLKISNEKLAEMQQTLKDTEINLRREHQIAKEASENITSMLQKLPTSIVIIDKDLKIIHANKSFIEMLGEEAKTIDEVIPGLAGADLKTLLPYNIFNLFSYVLNDGEDILNKDIHLEDKLLNVSVFTIRKNKIVGAVLRDMYVPEIRREEVINKVNDVIDKNLQMVQKIGFLLGEGASEIERMLNSIIESHKPKKKD